MTGHYYEKNPEAKSSRKRISYTIGGLEFEFETDSGVFSRYRVDYGSDLLIKSVSPLSGRVLDLGCGYGPIGIVLARLNPAARVVLADVNRRALTLAAENARLNDADNVEIVESDGFSRLEGKFDSILCNPPIRAGKRVVIELIQASEQHLSPSGALWLVVQKKQGADSLKTVMGQTFGSCQTVARSGGFHVLKSAARQPSFG